MHSIGLPSLLTLVFCLSSGLPVLAENWSGWRGPTRDGKVPSGTRSWPDSIGEGRLELQWRVNLEEGYASPVIAGDRVLTIETRAEKREVVRAFDRATGAEVWTTSWDGAMKVPFFARENGSWVRATPAVSGDAVLVAGMRDVLVRLDAQSGDERWRIDFVKREGTELPAFGCVSSPLIDGEVAYVQAGSAVTKIDLRTGRTRWKALEDRRAMFGSAFSSPVIATLDGKRQLVAQTRSMLGGLDLETGEVLWSTPVEAFRGMNILTPLVMGNRIFTATYGGGAFCFEVVAEDGRFSINQVWRDKELEGYMASPLAIGDHIYHLARDKHFYCIRMATGEIAWKTGEPFGDYWSMVANGNRVLALDERGILILFDATPEGFRELDRRRVAPEGEPTWAHLAVEGRAVYVRGLRSLTAFRWE